MCTKIVYNNNVYNNKMDKEGTVQFLKKDITSGGRTIRRLLE